MRQTQLLQQFREADVADRLEFPAGGVAQDTGQAGLAAAGGTLENNLVSLFNVVADGKAQDLSFVQSAVLIVLNPLNRSTGHSKVDVVETSEQSILLPSVPLGIHQEGQSFFKPELAVGAWGTELLSLFSK